MSEVPYRKALFQVQVPLVRQISLQTPRKHKNPGSKPYKVIYPITSIKVR